MSPMTESPMTAFPVRPLRFALGLEQPVSVVWSRTCPEFSVFLNALAMHVPHFERFLVQTLREVRDAIDDPALRRDVTAIIGQEANHAHAFTAFNQHLRRRYPDCAAIDDAAIASFRERGARASLKHRLGFTAGYETFTFLAGMIILKHHDRWFADADPTMKALWVWHQVEEIEHGAVAFEVWQHFHGRSEWLRKWMVLKAALHVAGEVLKLYPRMVRGEGWLRRPASAWRAIRFGVELVGRIGWAALPVFRRDYHPRRHPIATTAQDPIQIAWRRHAAAGGDVLAIDHARMAEIMKLAPSPAASPAQSSIGS